MDLLGRGSPCNNIKDHDGVVAGERAAGLGHDGGHGDAPLQAHVPQRAHHVIRIVLRAATCTASATVLPTTQRAQFPVCPHINRHAWNGECEGV